MHAPPALQAALAPRGGHVSKMSWKGAENGELLEFMHRHGFAGMVTIDKNMS